jgi:Paf1
MSLKDQKTLHELNNMPIEQQIEKIEKSFESAKKARLNALSHPKHKELEALEIFPIFPDFETWVNPYFLATYDEDPLGEKLVLFIINFLV